MFFRALRLELQIHRTRLLVLVIGVALIFIASDFSYYSFPLSVFCGFAT